MHFLTENCVFGTVLKIVQRKALFLKHDFFKVGYTTVL